MKPVLWGKKEDCSGCGACMQVCPNSAISMKEDDYGFLFPLMDKDLCIECQKCISVCPIKKNEINVTIKDVAYALKHKDLNIRKQSSSGGAFTAICEVFKPEIVIGASFTDNFAVHHIITSFDNISMLNKIADKIDYSRVLGLNSTVITIKN